MYNFYTIRTSINALRNFSSYFLLKVKISLQIKPYSTSQLAVRFLVFTQCQKYFFPFLRWLKIYKGGVFSLCFFIDTVPFIKHISQVHLFVNAQGLIEGSKCRIFLLQIGSSSSHLSANIKARNTNFVFTENLVQVRLAQVA